MKVDIKIDPDCLETAVVIHTKEMTNTIAALARSLQEQTQDSHMSFVVGFADGVASVLDINKVVRFYALQKSVMVETCGSGAGSAGSARSGGASGARGAHGGSASGARGGGAGSANGDGESNFAVKLRLYELEDRLPTKQFVRISHSEIINLKMVKDFDLSFAGSIQVRFINGTTTFVSRRYVAGIKKTLGL